MGRIKTKQIKRITRQLLEIHGEKLCDNFDKNKIVVNNYTITDSKKLKNVIAGYSTRLMKKNVSSKLEMARI